MGIGRKSTRARAEDTPTPKEDDKGPGKEAEVGLGEAIAKKATEDISTKNGYQSKTGPDLVMLEGHLTESIKTPIMQAIADLRQSVQTAIANIHIPQATEEQADEGLDAGGETNPPSPGDEDIDLPLAAANALGFRKGTEHLAPKSSTIQAGKPSVKQTETSSKPTATGPWDAGLNESERNFVIEEAKGLGTTDYRKVREQLEL